MNKEIKVAVVGGSGYTGLELVKLLQKHPLAQLRICFSTNADFRFSDYLPGVEARGLPVVNATEISKWVHELNTVFLATPPEVSVEIAPALIKAGVNVIDLSGAFRLKEGGVDSQLEAYQSYYKMKHPCPELLEKAEYGLMPWNNKRRTAWKSPLLIANPGCYATSVLMALLPLLNRNLIDPDSIVIDSKSGTSGAGRKASQSLLFTEVDGECLPYRVGKHQHLPEIRQYAKVFGNTDIAPSFATHLLPIRRGILSSIYAKLRPGVSAEDVTVAYCYDYSDYGLAEWGPLKGETERADTYSLSMKRVVGTGLTRIHYQEVDGRLYLFSILDNLLKGATSQAVENFNAIQNVALTTGLKQLEGVL